MTVIVDNDGYSSTVYNIQPGAKFAAEVTYSVSKTDVWFGSGFDFCGKNTRNIYRDGNTWRPACR